MTDVLIGIMAECCPTSEDARRILENEARRPAPAEPGPAEPEPGEEEDDR